MGTYKSNARTVLDTTQTSITSYSSGNLDVGDLFELAVDSTITAHTGGHSVSFIVSRIGADGNAYTLVGTPSTSTTGPASVDIGAALNNSSFGDQIKVDLSNPNNDTVSFTLSIIGKG